MADPAKTAKPASPAHERLHRLIDALPESALQTVGTLIEIMAHKSDHPAWAAMHRTVVEGEPDRLSDADREAVRQAYDEIEAGAKLLPHEEVKRRWLEAE